MFKKIKGAIGKRGMLGIFLLFGSILGYQDAAKDATNLVLGQVSQDQYGHISASKGIGSDDALDNLNMVNVATRQKQEDAVKCGAFSLIILGWGIKKYSFGKKVPPIAEPPVVK